MSFSRLSFDLDVKKVEHTTLGHTRIKKDELLKEDGSSYKRGPPESQQVVKEGRSCISQGTLC